MTGRGGRNHTDGYSYNAQIDGTNFQTGDYFDFTGTSASAAQVSALTALIYSRALKIGRLDGGGDDVTPTGVTDMIDGNLKSSPLTLGGSGKTVPGVVHFLNAKDEL